MFCRRCVARYPGVQVSRVQGCREREMVVVVQLRQGPICRDSIMYFGQYIPQEDTFRPHAILTYIMPTIWM